MDEEEIDNRRELRHGSSVKRVRQTCVEEEMKKSLRKREKKKKQ